MAKSNADTLMSNIARYSISHFITKILGAVYGFIKPRMLSPELYGLWNLLNLIPTYTTYIHLGSRSAMQYIIPYNNGRDEAFKNDEIKSTVMLSTFVLNMAVALIIVITALTGKFDITVTAGLLVMVAALMMKWYQEFILSLLKAYQNFRLLTSLNYLMTLLTVSFGIALLFIWGIYGLYMSLLLTCVIVVLYIRKTYPTNISWQYKSSVFVDLVRKGFPIMIFNFSSILLNTFDRILISHFLDMKQVGYYSFSVTVFTFMIQIPGAAREVMEPELMHEVSSQSKEQILDDFLFKPLVTTAWYLPFMIGTLLIMIPVATPFLFPKYINGIVPAQIVILGSYFFSLSVFTRGIIISNNWQVQAVILMVAVLVVSIILNIVGIKAGYGISGVACVSSVSCFLLFSALSTLIAIKYDIPCRIWLKRMLPLLIPFSVMCAAVFSLRYVFTRAVTNPYIGVALSLFVYLALMTVLIAAAEKKYPHLKALSIMRVLHKVLPK
ncbi:lipopolysaccharide biosynthesis protein [Candidatus Magnetominusculus xianensis]|uniref:Polysaccharide biosynthesis protein n=1 Tax=Candidatus Magnetominusculus xianensis TaxID=1748249 RepID=A0ABR5SEQ7_9BACT|nr:oligosaccharide flippase family protein [Candidatus Magnetominusculus xianensis]KWT85012.1 polysaccharide biosynthesis protein [Candidatus Magnetominusculus xianensis]